MKFETPSVTLRQLQYVVAIDELRSFSRAAERCHVSQPSLSAQLKLLEETIGIQLFERSRKGVFRAPGSELILDRAREVLIAAEAFDTTAVAARDPWAATWRLGVIPTVSPYLLPSVMPLLRKKHPDLDVRWTEAQTAQLVERIDNGELDGAFLALEADTGDLHREPVLEDRFVLAVAADHRLAGSRRRVDFDVLAEEPILLLDDGHCLRDQALSFCARTSTTELGYRATSLATLTEMVASGAGVTLLPDVAVTMETRRGRLAIRRFKDPEPSRTLGFVWRKRSPLADALTEAAGIVRRGIRSTKNL